MKTPNISRSMTIVGAILIVLMIVLATLFMKMSKENSKCERNPFVYGAEKTAEQGMDVRCSCTPIDPKYAGFNFDKDGLEVEKDLRTNLIP